jgi:hypothetical protein
MKMRMTQFLTTFAVVSVLLTTFAVFNVSAAGTRIYLDPSSNVFDATTISVGTKFNVTVMVENAPDVAAWNFYMEFNDTVLRVTRWFEPTKDPQYIFAGKTTSALPPPPDPGYVHLSAGKGGVQVAASLFPTPPAQTPASGSGKVCILEFNITMVPTEPDSKLTSVLRIDTVDTYFLDPDGVEIPGTRENGSYEINKPAVPKVKYTLFVDATTGGTTSPVPGSYVYDEGMVATVEAFNNSGYVFDHWRLDDLNAGSANPINVTMDGNHTLVAVFKAFGNEGDVNKDGKVDVKDVYAVCLAFGSDSHSPKWKPECDLNADGRVDIRDLWIVWKNYGKVYE